MLTSSSFYILFSVPESLCQHHLPPATFSQKILKKPTQCSLTLQLQMRFLTAFTLSFTLNMTRFFHIINPFLALYLIMLTLGSFGVIKPSTTNVSLSPASRSWRGCNSTWPISHHHSFLTAITMHSQVKLNKTSLLF